MAIGNFTDAQKSAINAKCPILVSAAAGSGKTAVLTERVIRKLTDKEICVDADKLLIVTFTNAAAFEMRSRIEKRLFEECAKNPQNKNLIKQRHLFGSADICTIDSFCINLVRENFEMCGVEPNFRVSDGSDMKAVCDGILTKIIDEQILENRDLYGELFELLGCEYDDGELKSVIEELYLYSRQIPFPDSFLDGLILPYELEFNSDHPWSISAKEIAKDYIDAMSENLEDMANCVFDLSVDAEKCDNYVKKLAVLTEELKQSFDLFVWDDFRNLLFEFVIDRITISSKNGKSGEDFKNFRKDFSENLKKLKALFSDDSTTIKKSNKRILPLVKCLVSLIKEYDRKSFEAFREENKLTFYHTEQLALNVLCSKNANGEISLNNEAKAYLSRYEEVMVDEFQDVNDLQNMLFYVLSNSNEKLFVVGDIKQSIYRFRGSNLMNFLSKKKSYIPFENAGENDPKKIILSDNFRSRKGVCDFVNFLFSKVMTEKTGEIVYGEEERLNPSADYPIKDDIETELLLIDKNEADEDSLFGYEAQAIAEYISDLVRNNYQVSEDAKTLRNVRYGDICILLDKVSNKAPIIAKKLLDSGIPTSYSNELFCETPEISLMLALLSVLDNPSRDIELLTVLMSPIFSFTPDDLAEMRADYKNDNIYAVVVNSAKRGNIKAKNFLESINKFRLDMALLPLSKLINKLIYDTGLLGFVSAMPNGKRRRNNLLSLPKMAEDFDFGTPTQFVDYLRELPESSFKKDDSESDFVKIMSMHKSKGLQFPICILSDLSSKINNADSISRIVYKENMGIGFKYYDETEKIYTENLGRKVIAKKIFAENNQEKMRLLYVAMTRAKEKLVLVCAPSNIDKTLDRISSSLKDGKINPQFVKSVNSLGDIVLAGCMLHESGETLRKICSSPVETTESDGEITVKITDCASIPEKIDVVESYDANSDIADKISNNISYVYPFEGLSQIESKTSVSAVAKGNEAREFYFSDRPKFMNKLGLSSAQKGTAMHTIMQFIEFSENVDVDSEIERLVEWQYITEEQGNCADREKLKDFFSGELYLRILKAEQVKREMRFLTELPAQRIDPKIDPKFKDSKIIVQGAVDLLFDEGDSLVVVDFKTDRVNSEETLINLYSEQLEIYAKACETIYKKPVKEKIIYSFHLGKIIPLVS